MRKDFSELVFILDRSGSMHGLESDTIGGFNSMLEKQKRAPGDAVVTTVLFDDQYELLHDRIKLAGIAPITEESYYVRGCTALIDAIGRTIAKIDSAQKHTSEDERAEHVLFVIITDGMENASREYNADQVRAMIERHKEGDKWEFLFLGANIDAVRTAASFGIGADRAVDYCSDSVGTRLSYAAVSNALEHARCCAMPLEANWKASVEKDFQKRGKRK